MDAEIPETSEVLVEIVALASLIDVVVAQFDLEDAEGHDGRAWLRSDVSRLLHWVMGSEMEDDAGLQLFTLAMNLLDDPLFCEITSAVAREGGGPWVLGELRRAYRTRNVGGPQGELPELRTVTFFRTYDDEVGTNLTGEAKSAFLRLAKCACHRNGPPPAREAGALAHLRRTLGDVETTPALVPRLLGEDLRRRPRHPIAEAFVGGAERLADSIERLYLETSHPGKDGRRPFRLDALQLFAYLLAVIEDATHAHDQIVIDVMTGLGEESWEEVEKAASMAWALGNKLPRIRNVLLGQAELQRPDGSPPSLGTLGLLDLVDQTRGSSLGAQGRDLFLSLARGFVLEGGGPATPTQLGALECFRSESVSRRLLDRPADTSPTASPGKEEAVPAGEDDIEALLEELDSLVGLASAKQAIREMIGLARIQKARQAEGLTNVKVSRHLVFSGSPGTGKTTVARLLSRIYRAIGILRSGQLVETDRSGLVAGYVGQTALKVAAVIAEARGGVLFVDEAYSLWGSGTDFGREAVDTLLKQMEDLREDLVVVVAGYTAPMAKLIDSNPGLKSRFGRVVHFEDYSPAELVAIFERFCSGAGYTCTAQAMAKLGQLLGLLHLSRDETFGNARLVRNIFERTITNQALRLSHLSSISKHDFAELREEDLPDAHEVHG